MKTLSGKVVLVTGASRGIGAEIAKRFGTKGSRVALAARSAAELDTVRKEIETAGGKAIAITADVGDLESLRALVVSVEKQFGPIDVLVNNAGIEKVWNFEDSSFEDIEAIVHVNVTGLIWLTRLVVPSMIARKSGQIVNISSVAGLTAVPYNAVYSASKHAVVGFSRSLRVELAEQGIGVSVVCPGFVEGGMFAEWGRKAPSVAGSVTVAKVVDAVISATERNRAEVVVTKGLGKLGDVFQAAAPEFTLKTMRRTGIVGYLREQAKINADRSK